MIESFPLVPLPLPTRRLKRLSMTPELLVAWFAGMREPRTFSCEGMPGDARAVACHYDVDARLIVVIVESASFPEAQAGHRLLELKPTFTEHFETVAVHR